MRSRTLTGAATAALGAVVVATAAPALAQTTLTQGTALSAPAGSCSLTVVDESTGYTAAHCGGDEWRIGSPVRTAAGEPVGTVSALPGESGVDLVRIALAEDARVVGDWSTRPAASVKPGETVYTHGSSVPLGYPNSLSHARAFDSDAVCADGYADQVALDAATTRPGDSGGAVYDAQQRVVGVISGIAPVTFDEDGRAVGCHADAMSSIMVPVEAVDALETTPAPAAKATRPAPKHAAEPVAPKAAKPAPKHAADLPTAGAAPVAESEVTKISAAEQKATAEELIARAEAAAKAEKPAAKAEKSAPAAKADKTEKRAKAEKPAATATTPAATAAPKAAKPAAKATTPAAHADRQVIVHEVAAGVSRGTRVQADTKVGDFAFMSVSALDADGDVLGHMRLPLTGSPMAWINVPADVPAGGSVKVVLVDAAGVPTDAHVTLGGALIG